jgi:uncharacterized SAM-binding protein YcdF (DUF218 family)
VKTRRQTAERKTVRKSAPRRRRGIGWLGRAILASAAIVCGMFTWAAIDRVLAPAENTSQEHFDALVVLGSPADADGNPSPTELARVNEAVREYERGVAPRIIVTGGAAHNRFVEAQVMGRVAEAQGIPAGQIVEEQAALNTIENTCNSVRIMRSHGWESAEVVSSASHLPRAAMILSRLPLQWRVHAAPPVEPQSGVASAAGTLLELLKTVHYLVWSRQMEPCRL